MPTPGCSLSPRGATLSHCLSALFPFLHFPTQLSYALRKLLQSVFLNYVIAEPVFPAPVSYATDDEIQGQMFGVFKCLPQGHPGYCNQVKASISYFNPNS